MARLNNTLGLSVRLTDVFHCTILFFPSKKKKKARWTFDLIFNFLLVIILCLHDETNSRCADICYS